MKIQIVTGNKNLNSNENITISDYASPMSPDSFEVNVIDLSFNGLWEFNGSTIGRLNEVNNLKSIACMINDSIKTKIVYVYPQDGYYRYFKSNHSFTKSLRIKDLITNVNSQQDYCECFPIYESHKDIVFEPTVTSVNGTEYSSSFRFTHIIDTVVTESDGSKKVTTIRSEKGRIFTTLDICCSVNSLMNFIEAIFKEESLSDVPDWVREFEFGSDKELKATIEASQKQISDLQMKIDNAEKELNDNNRIKSILASNGESLVEVVFEILEKVLDCDLSDFVDKSKEDFRVEKESIVFIGEIKGITSNVKNKNVSQLDVHYQSYLDELEDGETKDVKAILIINHSRNRKIDERDPVNEQQIELAKRNGSLIIETITLLKLFEFYLNKKITSEECIKLFASKTGLLSTKDFETQ